MPNRLSIESTAAGLSAQRLFLPPGEWRVFVTAPDWDSSKSVQIYVAIEDVTDSYRAITQELGGDAVAITKNDVAIIDGGIWVGLHLTNPGTGARLDFIGRQDAY